MPVKLIMALLGILSLASWALTTFTDPGKIEKPSDVDFLQIMQAIDPVLLCPECQVVRTPRSRHCGICDICVERYDHHCPWVNNCIGHRNHGIFMGFLIVSITQCLIVFSVTLKQLIQEWRAPEDKV
jgi:palmitoyltransferase